MPHEDIKIIIKKNGEIWVDLGDMEPQRIRHYKEIFEEAIGPLRGEILGSDGSGSSGGVRMTDHFQVGETSSEETDKKERLKDGG